MKTRIIHTKIHEDEWFYTLSLAYRYLFIYLFTNARIGHTGIYELSDRIIHQETKASFDLIQKMKQLFEEAKKVFFYKNWAYVVKSSLYGGYSGNKNEEAYKKELKTIPVDIFQYFNDRVSIGHPYSSDTTINLNNKLETINNKSKSKSKSSEGYKSFLREKDKFSRKVAIQ